MPRLILKAVNRSREKSEFVLDAFSSEPAPENILVTLPYKTERDEPLDRRNHVFRIEDPGAGPGEGIYREWEIDGLGTVDMGKLHWRAPICLRGRWELLDLRYGEHRLIEQPGLI